METRLFPDSETFTTVRPKGLTDDQQLILYTKFASEIRKNKWSKSTIEEIVSDLKDINLNDDGYEVAKKFESRLLSGRYDIDTQFVEYLDCLSHEEDSIHRKNVKDWVKAHNIKPKYATGTMLIIDTTLNYHQKKGNTVYINGLNKEEAYYLIHEDPDRKGGIVVPYEIVEERCSVMATKK